MVFAGVRLPRAHGKEQEVSDFERCCNCGERIELINFSLGAEWRHWPSPYGNYNTVDKYRHCRGAVAEPKAP